jgi:hypothetical protein
MAANTVVEQNRANISAAMAELQCLRESLPQDQHLVVDRILQRLHDSLRVDELYLHSLRERPR